MRDEGMNGLVRGRHTRTTIPAKTGGIRATDLLNWCFSSPRPNHGWVTDFTYVPTWSGFVYVAFTIDLYSGRSWAGPPRPARTSASSSSVCTWPCGGAITPTGRACPG